MKDPHRDRVLLSAFGFNRSASDPLRIVCGILLTYDMKPRPSGAGHCELFPMPYGSHGQN